MPSQPQPLSAAGYAALGMLTLGTALFVGWYLLSHLDSFVPYGVASEAYYVLLVLIAVASALFLFGTLQSVAKLKGTRFGAKYELGGATAVAVLIILGGMYLTVRLNGGSAPPTTTREDGLGATTHGPCSPVIVSRGRVEVDIICPK